ncbi:hypothetical protein GCK32_021955 [Trichostrongylus colubriformis]|uniref:Uncharacterized protein n=1 Tax=Trichostrongylus colubriformis TaxID=6319 RepID=A0AAN8G1K9_TRICO
MLFYNPGSSTNFLNLIEDAVETNILVHDIRANYNRKRGKEPKIQKKKTSNACPDAILMCDLLYMFVKFYDPCSSMSSS